MRQTLGLKTGNFKPQSLFYPGVAAVIQLSQQRGHFLCQTGHHGGGRFPTGGPE